MKLFLFALVFPMLASAQTLLDAPDRSELFESSSEQNAEYRFALGSMKKIDGLWDVEKSQTLIGDVQRFSYRLAAPHRSREAYEDLTAQLLAKDARQLFQCEGRACGSSAQWANTIFGVRELYGIDRTQFYSAWSMNSGDKQYLVSVYAVQRGNKSISAHVDLVVPQKPLQDRAAVQRLATVFAGDEDSYKAALKHLRSEHDGVSRWVLVGHRYGDQGLEQNIEASRQQAQDLRDRLLAAIPKLTEDTFRVYGMGPLAVGTGQRDRVEILRAPAASAGE